MMYRLSPHSTSDNDLAYRTKEEVERTGTKDGIPKYKQYLIDCGIWNEEQEASAACRRSKRCSMKRRICGEKAPFPKPEDILHHVYAGDQEGGR